jgi:hypothetical protein
MEAGRPSPVWRQGAPPEPAAGAGRDLKSQTTLRFLILQRTLPVAFRVGLDVRRNSDAPVGGRG